VKEQREEKKNLGSDGLGKTAGNEVEEGCLRKKSKQFV
jgi:hypothetical protein